MGGLFESFSAFNAAHWISLIVGTSGLVLSVIQIFVSGYRRRADFRREEFQEDVAAPIKVAVLAFEDLEGRTSALNIAPEGALEARSILADAKQAQETLSRKLRLGAQKDICSTHGWDELGSSEYDRFVENIAVFCNAPSAPSRDNAAKALEELCKVVRGRIEVELKNYRLSMPARLGKGGCCLVACFVITLLFAVVLSFNLAVSAFLGLILVAIGGAWFVFLASMCARLWGEVRGCCRVDSP